jgi:hypothetical protein
MGNIWRDKSSPESLRDMLEGGHVGLLRDTTGPEATIRDSKV